MKDINLINFKRKMIERAQKKGLYENFGQKEIRELKEKYAFDSQKQEAIKELEEWVSNFDLRQLREIEEAGRIKS